MQIIDSGNLHKKSKVKKIFLIAKLYIIIILILPLLEILFVSAENN